MLKFLLLAVLALLAPLEGGGVMLIAHRNGMATSVTLYRWIRMHISKVKANAGQVQLSEINMLDNGGGVYAWPEGTTCYNTTSHSNTGTFGTGQTPDKLIDGKTSTKMCAINLGSSNYFGFDIYIDLGKCVFDAQKWCKWCWYTADDNPGRDPVTFSLYLSTDAETWIPVDSCADVSITATRYALAYTGDINLNMEYAKTGLVAMWDGEWNAGGGVHDPNAPVWKELISGTDCTYSDANGTPNWVANGWESVVTDGKFFNAFYPDGLAEHHTLQFVVTKHTANYTMRGIICGAYALSGSNNCNFEYRPSNATDGIFRAYYSGSPDFSTSAVWELGLPSAFSLIHDNSTYSILQGVDVAATSTNGNNRLTQSIMKIGADARAGQFTFGGVIHSIRFYNRALTAAEIASNYAIDKARFNLP